MIVLWPLLVVGSIVGWGSLANRLFKRYADVALETFFERLGIGVTAVVGLTGLVVAVDRGTLLPSIIFIGAVIGVVELVLYGRSLAGDRLLSVALSAAVGAGLVILVGLYALSRTRHFPFLFCDDPTYMYLADRIIERGDLIDPMNQRRLVSLGGMSGLQAMFVLELNDGFLPLADYLLGGILLLSGVWRTKAGRWSVAGIAAVAILISFPRLYGWTFNTSPVLLPAGLCLLMFRLLVRVRSEDNDKRATFGLAAAVGGTAACAMALRPQFGYAMAVCIAVVILAPRFEGIRAPKFDGIATRLGGTAAGFAAIMFGWSVASWRAVRTPLFPVLKGNLDPTFPADGAATAPLSYSTAFSRFVDAVKSPNWLVASLLILAVVGINYLLRKDDRPFYRSAALVLVAFVVASYFWAYFFTVQFWNFGGIGAFQHLRYWVPLFVALALSPILLINMVSIAKHDWIADASRAGCLVIILLLALQGPDGAGKVYDELQADRSTGLLAPIPDPFAGADAGFAALGNMIPPGSKILSAMDLPQKIVQPNDTELVTLDVVGATSPSPHLPYFKGDDAKTDWLKQNGFTYVLSPLPNTGCLYNESKWAFDVLTPEMAPLGVAWGPYASDWGKYVRALAAKAGPNVKQVGGVSLIPVQ